MWLEDSPQHEKAFQTGALGEAGVGKSLEKRTEDGSAVVLHDRRTLGGRGNIDHVAIAPAGVFVVDAKAHSGKVTIERPLFGAAKLRIRHRTAKMRGHCRMYPKALANRRNADGSLEASEIEAIARDLVQLLPAA